MAKRLRLFEISFTLIFLQGILASCQSASHPWHGTPYKVLSPAPDFSLTRADGGSLSLRDLRGSVILLYFGYTFCPDVCPATLSEVRQIFDHLGPDADCAELVMITVDPQRDTAQVLQRYLARFGERFIGLYGSQEQLDEAMGSYGVFASRDPSEDPEAYFIAHTARLFLIDAQGMLRTQYAFGTPPEDILADVRYALQQEAP